jgi:hypothetical protein
MIEGPSTWRDPSRAAANAARLLSAGSGDAVGLLTTTTVITLAGATEEDTVAEAEVGTAAGAEEGRIERPAAAPTAAPRSTAEAEGEELDTRLDGDEDAEMAKDEMTEDMTRGGAWS